MSDDLVARLKACIEFHLDRADLFEQEYESENDLHCRELMLKHMEGAEVDRLAADEIERLTALIDVAAKHWLSLEPGVPWEGAIDAAMEAAVKEIERLRAELEQERNAAHSAGEGMILAAEKLDAAEKQLAAWRKDPTPSMEMREENRALRERLKGAVEHGYYEGYRDARINPNLSPAEYCVKAERCANRVAVEILRALDADEKGRQVRCS